MSLTESLLQNEFTQDLDEIDESSLTYKPSDKKLIQIYNYFYHKGFYNIVSLQIINLLTSFFMIFFLNFLFTCVEYRGLYNLKEEDSISNYVDLSNFYKNNFIYIFTTIILLIYILIRCIGLINDIRDYKKIKKFYHKKLEIDDKLIDNITWNTVVKKIEDLYGNEYNIYNTNMKILRKDNIITYILSTNLNNFLYSRLIEWNIIYCIFDFLFDIDYKVKDEIYSNPKKLSKNIKKNLRIVAFITYLFMPLLAIYLLFYSIIKYGEKFYNNPTKIISKQWSLKAKWKLRFYNELKHELKERLNNSTQYARTYSSLNNYKIVDTFFEFIIFVLSSIFIMLLILSFYNEHLLLNLNISKNKPILWYLGILGSIIAIGKNSVKKKKLDKENCIDNLVKNIRYLPRDFKKQYNISRNRKKISRIFEYQIYTLLKEYFSVLLIPFSLLYLINYVDNIIDVIKEHLEEDNVLGFVEGECNFRTVNNDSSDKKIISFSEFRKRYPDWGANIELYQIGENSKIIERSMNMNMDIQNTFDSNISII
jgi:autophagy-related protein 9